MFFLPQILQALIPTRSSRLFLAVVAATWEDLALVEAITIKDIQDFPSSLVNLLEPVILCRVCSESVRDVMMRC